MTTRTVADTSMEGPPEGAKAARVEPEADVPSWAAVVIAEMRELKTVVAGLQTEVRGAIDRYDGLQNKVEELELKVEEGKTRQASLEAEVEELKDENRELRGLFTQLRLDLDEQTDRSLRDHINFFNLKEVGEEKKWTDTMPVLAKWLADNVGEGTVEYYDKAIVRAHRGFRAPGKSGPRPIYAKMDYRVAEQIRQVLKFEKKDGVVVKDHYSAGTQTRLNQALIHRKRWMAANPRGTAYVKYPAVLKTKKATDLNYAVEQEY